jgi:hypothetical protein
VSVRDCRDVGSPVRDSARGHEIVNLHGEAGVAHTMGPLMQGGAERSGGVNKDKARALRLDSNLSWTLWPEITRTAVYLHN